MKNLVKSIWCLLFCLCAGNGWAESLEPDIEWGVPLKTYDFNGGVTTGVAGGNFGVTGKDVTTEMLWVGCGGATSLRFDVPDFSAATKWKLEFVMALDASVDAGIWLKSGGTDRISIVSRNAENATVTVGGNYLGAVVPVNNGDHANNDAALTRSKVTVIGYDDFIRITITDMEGEKKYVSQTVNGFFQLDNIGFFGSTDWSSFAYIDDVNLYVAAVPVTITVAGVATYCSALPLDFTNVDGLKAYVAVDADNNAVTMERVYKVPANTGLYLVGAAGSYSVPVAAETDEVEDNLLKGVTVPTPISQTDGSNTHFLLSEDGFKKASEVEGTLAAGKAYLALPSSMFGSGVNLLTLVLDGETGIRESVAAPVVDDAIYDLCGRRVEHPVRGIYIQGGKKVLFK